MKTLLYWVVLTCFLVLISACGGDGSTANMGETERADMGTADSLAESAAMEAPAEATGICLWEKVGLRSAAGTGNDAKYLTTIYFGEKVNLLGETEEQGDKNYLKVSLSDGKEGWVNEYLFATEAELAVVANDIEIYRRPDLMTATNKNLERGEIVAIKQSDKPGWVEVVGKERKKEGWVQSGANLTTEELDVAVVVLLDKALSAETPAKQEEELRKLSENSSFQSSIFIDLIQSELEALNEKREIRANQLYITADKINVRNLPAVEDSEVLFQLEEGDICNILRRTDEKIKINEMTDYWYKIECDGQEGWVFGYHTSKKGGDQDL